jgi:predicted AAA+ superfamily ATPase
MIARDLHQNILEDWDKKKAIVLLGPRQVGKTTLIQNLVEGKKVLFLNGDDPQTRLQFSNANFTFLKNTVADYDVIVIDEAQRIENIGITTKMLVDAKLDKQFIFVISSLNQFKEVFKTIRLYRIETS